MRAPPLKSRTRDGAFDYDPPGAPFDVEPHRRVSGAEAPDFGRAGDPAGDEHAARIEDRFLGSFNEEPAV